MKKISKILIVLLAVVIALSFSACGNEKQPEPAQTAVISITEATQAPAPEITEEPEATEAPVDTEEPAVTEEPAETEVPELTEEPAVTQEPEATEAPAVTEEAFSDEITVTEDGEYSDKEHVALYIHTYGHLPSNYVTKTEAEAAGWRSAEGNLYKILPGKSIGGERFGNYEKRLPEAKGRKYYECDINYNPKGKTSGRVTRGPERIVYSNDGLIFYTGDHYETFEQLY